jgi:restriction system protein
LLTGALRAGGPISFAALKRPPAIPEWRHGYLEQPEPAPVPETFMPPAPAGLSRTFGGGKYQQALAAGQTAYAQAAQEHRQREERGSLPCPGPRRTGKPPPTPRNAEAARQHAEIDAFEADHRRGDLDAVVTYCSMVLEASQHPEGFPQEFQIAYVPESRQHVTEYELPAVQAVLAVKACCSAGLGRRPRHGSGRHDAPRLT